MLYCFVDAKLEYSNRVVILLIMWVMAEHKRSSLCWWASDYCACAMGLGSQRARSFPASRVLSQQGKNERKERVYLLPVISSFSFPPSSFLISLSLLFSPFLSFLISFLGEMRMRKSQEGERLSFLPHCERPLLTGKQETWSHITWRLAICNMERTCQLIANL